MDTWILCAEQTAIMVWKHFQHKKLAGRSTLKEFLVPVFLIAFWLYIFAQMNALTDPVSAIYDLRQLPPLSSKGEWGIFQKEDFDDDSVDIHEFIGNRNLYYSPNDHSGVKDLMNKFSEQYPGVNVKGRKSPNKINLDYVSNLFETWASVEFDLSEEQIQTDSLVDSSSNLSTVNYKIRISPIQMDLPNSNVDYDAYRNTLVLADTWANSGYLTIQNFIASTLAQSYEGVDPEFEMNLYVQRYPKDSAYEKSPSFDVSSSRFLIWKWMASVLLTCAIILPILSFAAQTVHERENNMQALLQISGLLDSAYWISFEIAAVVFALVLSFVVCLLLLAGQVLTGHSFGPYLILMVFYSMALFAFLMAFGFIIFRSQYYGLPAFLLSIALGAAGDYSSNDYNLSIGAKLFLGFLFPPLNFTLGVFGIETYIYHHEDSAVDFDHSDHTKNLASLSSVIGVLFASSLLYLFICWGMPFDWLIPSEDIAQLAGRGEDAEYPIDDMDQSDWQPTDSSSRDKRDNKVLLDVKDVCHVYPDGTRAVKGISFKVHEGEVLSYLGANGAGKSTTMNMLCGTLKATFGDAVINGFSISRERSSARHNLGICMQQNVIWDDISIVDHLYLFARLRGRSGDMLKKDVQSMMEHLGFPEKAHSPAGTLSGGQKRRLCVGISMVGGNSVVYLDEPTAGLDPVSRRQLWELVQLNRVGRAILLTTHFLDEADVLGDRIAIVKEGRMRAIGTSGFLKNRFGMGYLMRTSLQSDSKPDDVLQLVQEHVPEAEIVSSAGTEFSIRMPKESVSSFPTMFEKIDSQSKSLGVINYGIETTTLEEVFIRIVNEDSALVLTDHERANQLLGASGQERDDNLDSLKKEDNKRHPLSENQISLLLTKGRKLGESELNAIHTQVQVLVWKRFFQFVRSKGQWSMGALVPIALIVVSAILTYKIPNGIIRSSEGVTDLTYDSPFETPVSGNSENMTTQYIQGAGVDDYLYVGESYSDLYGYLENNTNPDGASSGAAVYYHSLLNATVLYNSSYPLLFAGLVGDILQTAVSNVTQNRLVVNAECEPLPDESLGEQTNYAICFFFVACLISGSLGSAISIVVSGERVGLVKHQQLASGVSLLSYWTANFVFDYTVAGIHALGLTFGLYCARASEFEGSDFALIFGIGLLFNITALYRFYTISYFLSDIRMAQTFFFYGSLLSQFVLILIYSTVVYNVLGGNASDPVGQVVAIVCTVLDPTFGYLFVVQAQNDFLGVRTLNNDATVANTPVTEKIIITIFIMAIVYMILVVYLEDGFACLWSRKKTFVEQCDDHDEEMELAAHDSKKYHGKVLSVNFDEDVDGSGRVVPAKPHARKFGTMDPDVVLEKARVDDVMSHGNLNPNDNAILVRKLNRVYYGRGSQPTKVAVKNLSLSIELGEIFGLLGANGAGKTTLLKMVSGLENPSGGEAYVNGYDIVADRRLAQRSMGLCPQFDTLVERLSVRENIIFFATIKGIDTNLVGPVCEAYMAALNIKRYENKLIQHLSGGNRRKVSLAVALLGAPPTVYLDEPSTGLDPVASRLMWRLLSKIGETKSCAIVLTTHNMLECEAVCTRVGVMKTGELVCLGDSMHLRSTHGTGFLLEMNLRSSSRVEDCKEFVAEHFTGAIIIDEHSTMLNFEIPAASIDKLSNAFSILENNKESLDISDYSMSQSTLEQVFLKQIRPNEKDEELLTQQRMTEARVPVLSDYIMGYMILLLAFFIPGLHHFYLGNFWRGVKYLFTLNEFWAGWFLDIFEYHVLIRKSVEQYGSQKCCEPCHRNCCCCLYKRC